MAEFKDSNFSEIKYDDIPLNRDCLIVCEDQIDEFEQSWLTSFTSEDQGGNSPSDPFLVAWASVEVRHPEYLELNISLNHYDRFHGIKRKLPKPSIVKVIGIWGYQKRPYIFVNSEWWKSFEQYFFSSFALIDAIDFKKLLYSDNNSLNDKLNLLREKLDQLSSINRNYVFLSAGDGLIIKTNWKAFGQNPPFSPEHFILLFGHIRDIFQSTVGCDIYGIYAQGFNEYRDGGLFHLSESKNHISLNSLGTPFAQLFDMETNIRSNIRKNNHKPYSIYMTRDFFLSLRLNYEYRSNDKQKTITFSSSVTPGANNSYICENYDELINNLEEN